MPANNGLRLDENQCRFPSRPKPPQHHPKQFIWIGKPGLWMPPFENRELLPKSQVFQEEVAARPARLNDQIEQELQRTEHEFVVAEASRISMQKALGLDPIHTPLYPTENTCVPDNFRGLSTEGCWCRRVWRGSLDTVSDYTTRMLFASEADPWTFAEQDLFILACKITC
jgi:hypothetical protein